LTRLVSSEVFLGPPRSRFRHGTYLHIAFGWNNGLGVTSDAIDLAAVANLDDLNRA